MAKIVFHTGGGIFHPTADQARFVTGSMLHDHDVLLCEGRRAFECLDGCDLLVLMGIYWKDMDDKEWAGAKYEPLEDRHKETFTAYVKSGRPLLAVHGSSPSYDDWPDYAKFLGVQWVWGKSHHPELGEYRVRILDTGHPVVAGISDFTVWDDVYCDQVVDPSMSPQIHAVTAVDGRDEPMLITGEGGRIEGAGRMVYIANGHDMRTIRSVMLRRVWANAIEWLLP